MFEKNKNENIKFVSLIIGSIIVLILALFLSIIFGKAHVSIPTIFDAIFNYNPKIKIIILLAKLESLEI